MDSKMTIEEFRRIKERIIVLYNSTEEKENRTKEDEEALMLDFDSLQSKLLSSDLSDIPYEEWEGMILYSDDDLDLSKTHANIDFSLLGDFYFTSINLKGCNPRGINRIKYNEDSFDPEYVESHPEFFPDKSLPESIIMKYYNKDLDFSDLLKYPQLRKSINKEVFFNNYEISSSPSSSLISAIGFDYAIRLFDEYPEFVSFIAENKNKNTLFNLKTGYKFDRESFDKNGSYEEAKEYVFSQVIKEASFHSMIFPPEDIIPEEMIASFPDSFIKEGELPAEVIEHYYSGNLSLSELRQYRKVFETKNIDLGLSSELKWLQGYYDNNIWNYIDSVPKELDTILLPYYADQYVTTGGDIEKTKSKSFEVIIKEAVDRIYYPDFDINQLYILSQYIPLDELIYSQKFEFINKIGIEKLVEFNNKYDNILDEKTYYGGTRILDYILDHCEFYLYDQNIETLDQLYVFFKKQIHDRKDGFYSYNEKKLYKVFPSEFLDDDLIDSLLGDMPYKEGFVEKLKRAFNSNVMELVKILKQNPMYYSPVLQILDNKDLVIKNVDLSYYGADHLLGSVSLMEKFCKRLGSKEFLNLLVKANLEFSEITSKTITIRRDNGEEEKFLFLDYISEKFGNEKTLQIINDYNGYLYIQSENGLRRGKHTIFRNEFDFYIDKDISLEELDDLIETKCYENIIEHNLKYYDLKNNKEFVKKYPELFIDEEKAPPSLVELLYNRELTPSYLKNNPECIDFVKHIDLEILFGEYWGKNIKQFFSQETGFDLYLMYGDYLLYMEEHNYSVTKSSNYKSDIDLLNNIEIAVKQAILDGCKYDEHVTNHFKTQNPELFLSSDVPIDIKTKFYNRELTVSDFKNNPDLINIIGETNIVCGFPRNFSWIASLYENIEDKKLANEQRFKIIEAYSRIDDEWLCFRFKDYIEKHINNLNMSTVDDIAEVLSRLNYSNSFELNALRQPISKQLLESDNPIERLNKIEKIFVKNNLPLCGKMFLVFQTFHPDLDNDRAFAFDDSSRMTPTFKDSTLPRIGYNFTNSQKRMIITFNDLLRDSYRSQERSLLEYINNIELGNDIYYRLNDGSIRIDELTIDEKEVLEIFVNHLEVLYQNTERGKDNNININKMPLEEKVTFLAGVFDTSKRFELKDNIVRDFCYFAGVKSLDELKALIIESKKEQEERIEKNLQYIEDNDGIFKFEEGDFVRGFGFYEAFSSSLGTGNYCKEHLGAFVGTSYSDTTPLDVDLTLVTDTDTIYDAIDGTPTGFGFGNLFMIIKKDNPNIYITRDEEGNLTGEGYQPSKVEVFGTKIDVNRGYKTHWGARTGISFADVDYLLYKEQRQINDEEPYKEDGSVNYEENPYLRRTDFDLPYIKFLVARNGYYIPIIDFTGKIIFTKEEYDSIREKMAGLSYFNENDYTLSSKLVTDEVLEIANTITDNSVKYTSEKRNEINKIIKEVLDEMGLDLKTSMDGDLTPGSVEFIDTGSTGRNTNIPYDGDFDFFMRLDAEIIRRPEEMEVFKEKIIEKMEEHNMEGYVTTDKGDLRFKDVQIDEETTVNIDISFGVKTNKVKYSSDQCLSDRLSTIYKTHPEEYKLVVANIIQAKMFLKNIHAYKPHRTDSNQGGLGGIGVENWILQNGGSFVEACRTFIDKAIDENGELVPFEEFKKNYEIWDFGENHFAARKSENVDDESKSPFLYDNFVDTNMNSTGYENMAKAIKTYLEQYDSGKDMGHKSK